MTQVRRQTIFNKKILSGVGVILALMWLFSGCASSLQKAKLHLAGAQEMEKSFRTDEPPLFIRGLLKKLNVRSGGGLRLRPTCSRAWPRLSWPGGLKPAAVSVRLRLWGTRRLKAGPRRSASTDWLFPSRNRDWPSRPCVYIPSSANGVNLPQFVQTALGRLIDSQLELLPGLPEKSRKKLLLNLSGW